MARISKIVILSITTAVIAGIIGICLVAIFINPNRFKAELSEQISRRIGCELLIHGDINWTWLPWLALHISDVELGSHTSFNHQPLAHINALALQVQLLPLLQHKLAINSLEIQGIDIHLIKDSQGNANWQRISLNPPLKPKEQPTQGHATIPADTQHHVTLNMEQLKIHNAHLDYFDARQHQTWQINNFDLESQHLSSNHNFPLQAQGDFVKTQGTVIHVSLDGVFDPLQKNLAIQSLSLKSQPFQGKGKALLKSLTNNPSISFDLTTDYLDLTTLPQNKSSSTALNHQANQSATGVKPSLNLPISGSLHIKKLKAYSVTLNQVAMQLLYQNDRLQITPISAQIAGGTLQGSATIVTNTEPLKISCSNQLRNIDIKSLLNDLNSNSRLKMTGIANITSQLTLQGSNTHNLQGQGKLALTQGVWEGIDIFYYIDMAQALIKKQALPTLNNNRTEIGQLTASFTIQDGVLSNQDLKLQGPQISATGRGTLDLNQKTIDYRLFAIRLDERGQQRGQWVPIRITGSLAQPKIELDTDAVLKQQLQKQVDQLKDKVSDTLQKNLGKALNSLFNK